MKKLSILFSAAAALLISSCADEIEVPVSTGDGNVNFTIELPGAATSRAMGDGYSATILKYVVFDGDEVAFSGNTSFTSTSLQTTVSLNLLTGKTYRIAFFASNTYNSVYTLSNDNKAIVVNYKQMNTTSTWRDYDAFYKAIDVKVTGPINETITLPRVMAQLNWGTDDYDTTNGAVAAAYGTSLRTRVKTKAYTNLNLIDGTVENEVEVYTNRNMEPLGASFGAFPAGEQYRWLMCTYLLLPENSPLIDASLLTFKGSNTPVIHTVEVTNIPVERNFRTNIYGSLLTSTASYTIDKNSDWTLPHNNHLVWQGESKDPVKGEDGIYHITSPAELAGLSKMVAAGNTFAGETVQLDTDINLLNLAWTPIGSDTKKFQGNFDGGNHTISNVNVSLAGKPSQAAGLFGWVENGKIANLHIDGATVSSLGKTTNAVKGTGAAVGKAYITKVDNVHVSNATIDGHTHVGAVVGSQNYANLTKCSATDCTVTSHFEWTSKNEWDNGDKAGAIAGFCSENTYTHTGNTATNVTVKGYRHIGGLFGYIHYENVVKDNSATNVTVIQDFEHNPEGIAAGTLIGQLAGYIHVNAIIGDNDVAGVTLVPAKTAANVQEAIAALSQGGNVAITASMDFSALGGELTIDKPTTITVAPGATIKIANMQLVNTSELTINGGGTIQSGGIAICNENGGTLTIESGDFIGGTANGTNLSRAIHNEGDLIINGGTFTSTYNALTNNTPNVDTPTSVTINGGTFVSTDNYALNFVNGLNKYLCTVVINGGTFKGAGGGGRAEGNVDITINGGTFIGSTWHGFCTGAEAYSAHLVKCTVNGGYFYGISGHALCRAGSSAMTVNGGYLNKTTGSFTLAEGATIADANETITFDGNDYIFTKQVVK